MKKSRSTNCKQIVFSGFPPFDGRDPISDEKMFCNQPLNLGWWLLKKVTPSSYTPLTVYLASWLLRKENLGQRIRGIATSKSKTTEIDRLDRFLFVTLRKQRKIYITKWKLDKDSILSEEDKVVFIGTQVEATSYIFTKVHKQRRMNSHQLT